MRRAGPHGLPGNRTFGSRPRTLALVMAALGLVSAVAFRKSLMRAADPATATVAALIWAVSPSSSSLRFWPATAPILVSMILIGGAWYLAFGDRVRPWQVTSLVAVSTVTYESGVLIGVAAVGVALWRVAARVHPGQGRARQHRARLRVQSMVL